jgi:hypothetical protein
MVIDCLSLCSDPKEIQGNPRLSHRIAYPQPFVLPLAYHVYCLNSLARALRSVKGLDALRRISSMSW